MNSVCRKQTFLLLLLPPLLVMLFRPGSGEAVRPVAAMLCCPRPLAVDGDELLQLANDTILTSKNEIFPQ